MIRLDRFLTQLNICTRSEAKEILKKGRVRVNGIVCKNGDFKINELTDNVTMDDKTLIYEKNVYFMLNKPAGYVSATTDNRDKTVLSLLENENIKNIFPVGRLDKDTEGLLLLTNDGELAHNLLSPKKHVDKTYRVITKHPVTKKQTEELIMGVDIGEEKNTLPSQVKQIGDYEIHLTICEGKFHQVKRMLKAVGNEVVYLERLRMGSLILDDGLLRGEYRKLTEKEIMDLKEGKQL